MPQRLLRRVRIIDFGEVFAGPYATTLLADAGADVIKIESVQRMPAIVRGDRTPRPGAPGYVDGDPGDEPWERYFYYHCVERNKRGITLNLADPTGRDLFERLICTADAVVSNYAGGVLDRLGFGYERLCAIRPDIVLLHLPGFGTQGPYRDHVSFAMVTEALSGLFALRGYPESAPEDTAMNLWSDGVGALTAAFATLAALRYRSRTGRGQFIDISQAEASTTFASAAILDLAMNGRVAGASANADPVIAPNNTYPCAPDGNGLNADDRWVAISAGTAQQWATLCRVMGRPDLVHDARFRTAADRKTNEAALDAEIAAWTRTLTRRQAADQLRAAGVPASPVLDDADLESEPQVVARGSVQRLRHPKAGEQPYITGAWQIDGEQRWVARPPNTLGEHNSEVLCDLLGLDVETLAALRRDDVIGETYLPSAGRG
jgi:crotonobetainyl-CoA:carnitine CoA-transferase CaiB-like acyl-CoA transferase